MSSMCRDARSCCRVRRRDAHTCASPSPGDRRDRSALTRSPESGVLRTVRDLGTTTDTGLKGRYPCECTKVIAIAGTLTSVSGLRRQLQEVPLPPYRKAPSAVQAALYAA